MPARIVVLTLLSAVLFPLALPNELFPFGSPILGLVALIPYYLAIRDSNDPRTASRLGALFGGVSTLLGNYWLMFFGEFSVWTIGGTTLGYVAYNWLLAAFLWRATRTGTAYRPMLFALLWTLYEYLKSIGFLAYPWSLAAYPFSEWIVFTQLADVTGVWGLTFLAVYANASIAELCCGASSPQVPGSRPARQADRPRTYATAANLAMTMILVALAGGYGLARLRADIPIRTSLDLLLVQQNADSWNTHDVAQPLFVTQQETESAIREATVAPDLIVWSETSLRHFYQEGRDWYAANPREKPFLQFVSELPAPLLTGSPYQSPDDDFAIHNAVLLIDTDTEVRQWYGKQHLVPFAENIPFRQTDLVRRFFQNVVGLPGVWAPGPGTRVFTASAKDGSLVTIGTPICFEDAFAYLNRQFARTGAELIVNLTNNSWSRTNSAQMQHFVASRFRAIETRRGLVRSTNSGYTTVVDPWGRIVVSVPMFVTTHLSVQVPVYAPERESVYMLLGDWVPQLIAVFLAVLLIAGYALPGTPKKREPTGPPFISHP